MIGLQIGDVESKIPHLKIVGVDDKVVAYTLTGGDYKGVSYTYANIRFNVVDVENGNKLTEYKPDEIDPDDPRYALEVAFEFVILDNKDDQEIDTNAFKNYIGAILVRIIELSVA